ncbi:GNAT family N-acetyltransferase [Herbiconiux sp. CPCC 205716]|uniref:GNAT family N-acetyltransferase n=1 Tax=Herbiconiux gentiana TaxID=2970912 RepID=A0ABT2GHG1_9MICO|nr:GNAT family protein [Herbiconiux gentiana]MCS5715663.1 GNAT family N-acetyltransferase [Herbiconiux gentiana]
MSIDDVWPLFALRLETPRLVLRVVRDDDLPGLADAAIAGIHGERMPFMRPWSEEDPATLRRSLAQFQWRRRAELRPESWGLNFVVLQDGRPIGVQDLEADDFATLRTVSTGSWLTRSAQGQGLGTEMRQAVLTFAFDHLGADFADSGAFDWNEPSLAVSRKLGYRPNGLAFASPRPGERVTEQRLRLAAADFARPPWPVAVTASPAALTALLGERAS